MEINHSDSKQQRSNNSELQKSSMPIMVNVTVRADAECQLICDGDYVALLLPMKIVKMTVPAGQHLIQFISTECPDVVIEHIVDWMDDSRCYLLLEDGLESMVSEALLTRESTTQEYKKEDEDFNREGTKINGNDNAIDFIRKYIDPKDSNIKSELNIDAIHLALDNEILPAVDFGNPGACFVYSQLLCFGKYGIHKDETGALKHLMFAAEGGIAQAQYLLANRYKIGDGVEKDYHNAIKWYTKAAEQGHLPAQNNLGYCYCCGIGIDRDYDLAVEWFNKAAEQGDQFAQNNLGNRYYKGQGVAQDYIHAVYWFTKAAEQGNPDAQNSLAYCYQNGFGVDKDFSKAVELYMKASAKGQLDAKLKLGFCYFNGEGVEQSYYSAFKCFEEAASLGYPEALYYLGSCYCDWIYVDVDYEVAAELFKQSAEGGYIDALYSIAYCYEHGQGVPQDISEANKWLAKAKKQESGEGVPNPSEWLSDLEY